MSAISRVMSMGSCGGVNPALWKRLVAAVSRHRGVSARVADGTGARQRAADPPTGLDAVVDPRVREIRAQIAADKYLTDDKLDFVVDRLHELLTEEQDRRRPTALAG